MDKSSKKYIAQLLEDDIKTNQDKVISFRGFMTGGNDHKYWERRMNGAQSRVDLARKALLQLKNLKMLDFRKYPVETLYHTLKASPKYNAALAKKVSWGEAVKVIQSLELNYTNDQLGYVKQKDWE